MFADRVILASRRTGVPVELSIYGVALSSPWQTCGVDWSALPALDGLIVTGSHPKRLDVGQEPAVPVVEEIIGAAGDDVPVMFSCQSAHIALSLLHGIRRVRLPRKRHGVFEHQNTAPGHPLGLALPARAPVPHSRWNAVPATGLERAGLRVVLGGPGDDWHLATSPDGLDRVFLQGHCEYPADMLLREYRRDVRRHLQDADALVEVPENYFHAESERRLRSRPPQHARPAEAEAVFGQLDGEIGTLGPRSPWDAAADTFFADWTRMLAARIAARADADLGTSGTLK
ncbi:homoserine O-succinyltransferase [Streptomyces sp. NPDC020681]|uniref:homoserine O-acetyltransferase/O-succinyltransferase family protein n=1 Tax=Streptomyces sp. NPDC020681 TaxID=3365083 RepID=UPI0037890DEA